MVGFRLRVVCKFKIYVTILLYCFWELILEVEAEVISSLEIAASI